MSCSGTDTVEAGSTSAEAELEYHVKRMNTHTAKAESRRGVFLIGKYLSEYHSFMASRHSNAIEFIHMEYLGE